jgi:hypothetical protein
LAVLTNFLLLIPADMLFQKNAGIVPHIGPLQLTHSLVISLLDAADPELLTA